MIVIFPMWSYINLSSAPVITVHLGGCPRIDILFKIEVFQKNTHSHIVDISESRPSLTGAYYFDNNKEFGQNGNMNMFVTHALPDRTPEFHETPVGLDECANTASAGSIIA